MIDHTADVGIEVTGTTLEELFANAGKALIDLITDQEKVVHSESRILSAAGNDREELLINWLGEILYLFHGDHFLTGQIEVTKLAYNEVKALIKGERYDPSRHEIKAEIKAVTFHQTRISRTNEAWTALVIFDV